MRKKISAAMLGMATVGAFVLSTGGASSHGYTDLPASRQINCAKGVVQGCGSIQYEPQSVEGPKGFPASGPADGKICSAGVAGFNALNGAKAPNGGAWPTTKVSGGQNYSFRWQFTARHRTTNFAYYITKPGWNESQPITRASLEPQPFFNVPYGGQQPPATLSHSGTIPGGRSGHHVIVAVWNVHDTANAFYACSDVQY
ncbi:lytic polysaccharide monooxygenase [Streptomyces sp. NPDC017941]|uniref:lytic polysaccharide monooxygenase auxiliary activity family 9 protein n=1 Tax=unclassified Streptomyces TaxID=2593676 RepID=UPI00378EDAF6